MIDRVITCSCLGSWTPLSDPYIAGSGVMSCITACKPSGIESIRQAQELEWCRAQRGQCVCTVAALAMLALYSGAVTSEREVQGRGGKYNLLRKPYLERTSEQKRFQSLLLARLLFDDY